MRLDNLGRRIKGLAQCVTGKVNPWDIGLRLTCSMMPEQYDAYWLKQRVGYLRLRHGYFRVDVPDCGGVTVYEAEPRGDGAFYDGDERERHLYLAKKAIADWLNG